MRKAVIQKRWCIGESHRSGCDDDLHGRTGFIQTTHASANFIDYFLATRDVCDFIQAIARKKHRATPSHSMEIPYIEGETT